MGTIQGGFNLAVSLNSVERWSESRSLVRDQLLPVARQSLGAEHNITLRLEINVAINLMGNPERTRDGLLEAETIVQGVLQRRRQIFGPAHPSTRECEQYLRHARAML